MKRKIPTKGGLYFDAGFVSSEEEADITVDCHASSGGVEYSYTPPSTKRQRRPPSPVGTIAFETCFEPQIQNVSTLLPSHNVDQGSAHADSHKKSSASKPKCKQGASVMMASFSKELPKLEEYLFDREYDSRIERPCECGSKDAKFRCRACTQSRMRCRSCIVQDHRLSAWHHLEEWTGTHFSRTSVSKLGYRHRLGHNGKRCPSSSPEVSSGRKMIIVHTNGFHEVFVEFCVCNSSRSAPHQLMSADLFPATLEKPETAFTFELLDTFQKLSLRSKINAYDYHHALREMTDSVMAEDVPNRYHEFVRSCRLWDHMVQVRRSGQCHGFDEIFPHRRQGSITVRCPACPEIHVNVDKKILDSARDDETHKYTLFLSIDGNFKLRRKNKCSDPDDVSLNDGRGYFVAASPYASYQEHTKTERDEDCECSHLRALKFRNAVRFKNTDVSGVIIVQCARHGLYLPGGIADLIRGEAFRFTDYVLVSSLADALDQRWILVTYDIWCSYHKNLDKRVARWFLAMLPIIQKIRGAIPKMHIKNHKVNCQYCWALNFLRYSGETWGELIEACHSEQNGAAASTREQNPGHRHDSLDGILNYWNWTKFRTMALLLYRAYVKCLDTLKAREKNFRGLVSRLDPNLVKEWETVDDTPKIIDNEVRSVHRPTFGQGPPTLAKAHERLRQEESTRKKAGLQGLGATESILKGLELEEMQQDIKFALRNCDSEHDSYKLAGLRQELRDAMDEWRIQQLMVFPKLCDEYHSKVLDSLSQIYPEDESLLLPSYFSEPHRMYLELEFGAEVEMELRRGRAHDELEEVRKTIQTYNHHIAMKAKEVRSQRHMTRSQGIITRLRDAIRVPARRYNRTREAMIKLGLPNDDPVFQQLKDTELWAKNTALPTGLGDSRVQDPWFWHIACPAGASSAERAGFQCEMDRVKYFRDRSLRDRAREEREILEEEFRRTICSYSALHSAWLRQGETTSSAGRKAYAQKQAAMLERLRQNCIKHHAKATQKAEEFDKWFQGFRDGCIDTA
ncbi:hypothetical protein CVT26_001627 [Gymnopilus dilepis]|uniref:CxC2-like cysteine cluster KDZ transposase-associated domain-containing protein n=1 Tax=Gymnopilus dilepis TaxID=231916 RepID=A0A409WVS8_9AGAR|nr:hypothetical protein CVT26_001627 [Gymnopilus dilepis]